jgi:hypothetical protein
MDEFDLEREDKLSDFQKKYNITQKNFAAVLGKNLTLFLVMLLPLLLIGFVWTDFGKVVIDTKMISDGILTVMLFTCGECLMCKLGSDGGRLDSEFISSKKDLDGLLEEVGRVGTMLITMFCEWQIDLEMEQAIRFRLRMIRMGRDEYDSVKDDTPEELRAKYGRAKARKIMDITELKPIDLNESILLYNGEYAARGGVPISGDAYLRSKKSIVETVLACIFTGLLTVSVVVTLTSDITMARVIYTMFKLAMLLFRMVKGFDRGARAYNTIEVRMNKAKANYLRQYLKFIEDKTYLRLGDKYGDISDLMPEEPTAEA